MLGAEVAEVGFAIFHFEARFDSGEEGHSVARAAVLLVSDAGGEIMAAEVTKIVDERKFVVRNLFCSLVVLKRFNFLKYTLEGSKLCLGVHLFEKG